MARNKINDLRDHLFSALERLDNDELTMEELNKEIEKAQAVATIGSVIIQSAKIEVDYIKATGMIESSSELFKNINEQKSYHENSITASICKIRGVTSITV